MWLLCCCANTVLHQKSHVYQETVIKGRAASGKEDALTNWFRSEVGRYSKCKDMESCGEKTRKRVDELELEET